jgi:hypothetical protein
MNVTCPGCGYECDTQTGIDTQGPPDVGALSICLNCGFLSSFTAYGLRPLTQEEMTDAMTDDRVVLVLGHIKQRGLFR